MGNMVVSTSISTDGFMGRPDGALDWLRADPESEHARDQLELLAGTGTIVVGSRTARDMAAHWSVSEEPLADPMNTLPKLVFSSSGAEVDWTNVEVTAGGLRDEIERLKREDDRDIVAFGGASFVQSLTRQGLVDEYRLTVYPTILGAGLPIFDGAESQIDLELIESKTLSGGAVSNRFRRA